MENPVLNRILLVVSLLGILFFTLYGLYSFTDFWRDLIPKTTDSSFFQKAAPSNSTSLKTYQNEFLSFTLKYPSNLTYTGKSPQEPQLYERVSFYEKELDNPFFLLRINQVSASDHEIFNQASLATPDKPVSYEDETNEGIKQQITLTPVSLSGIDWVKTEVLENDQKYWVYLTTQKKDEAVYTISLSGEGDVLEQIIRTFTFTQT